MKSSRFRYHCPASLEEAVRILAEVAPGDGRVIAGRQSLGRVMAFRMCSPPDIVDINHLRELDVLDYDGDQLRIGAGVRHEMLGALGGATGRPLAKSYAKHCPCANPIAGHVLWEPRPCGSCFGVVRSRRSARFRNHRAECPRAARHQRIRPLKDEKIPVEYRRDLVRSVTISALQQAGQ